MLLLFFEAVVAAVALASPVAVAAVIGAVGV